MRATLSLFFLMAWLEHSAVADTSHETRDRAPDPAKGESYDGRSPDPSPSKLALAAPRVLFLPLRLLLWALESPARALVQLEERRHLYDRLYYTFTSVDGQIGVRPAFEWSLAFRPSVGVHLFDHRLLGPGTKLDLDLSGGIDVVHAALHARPTRIGRRVQLHLDSVFDRRNDFLFTGLGATAPLTPAHQETRYLANLLDVGGRLDLRSHPFVVFSFGGFFGLRRFANDEAYWGDPQIAQVYCVRIVDRCVPGTVDEALVPGFNRGTQFLRGSAALHVDLRDNLVRPTLGALLDAEADYSHGLGWDDSSYFRIRGALSLDLNLWRGHSHVLVVRGVTQLVAPLGDAAVPFTELPTLGGPNDLRGFRWQEFRDFSSLLVTAEYRWPILLWADAALFVDYGGVFDRTYHGFGAPRMQPDVGLGVRLHSRDRFYLRVQLAYGFGNGWQFYLSGQNLP